MTVGEQERMAFSEDAAQFLKIRPDGEGCIEIEAINKSSATAVWLGPEGITELLTAISELTED